MIYAARKYARANGISGGNVVQLALFRINVTRSAGPGREVRARGVNSIRNCIGSLVSGPVNRPELTDARNIRHVTLINSYFCPSTWFVYVAKNLDTTRIMQLIINNHIGA